MEDLNAKVGQENTDYERVIKKRGIGTRNDNGERLKAFRFMINLVIGGTLFPHRDIHKPTLNSPNGRQEPKCSSDNQRQFESIFHLKYATKLEFEYYTQNILMLSKQHQSTELDRKYWLHVPIVNQQWHLTLTKCLKHKQ